MTWQRILALLITGSPRPSLTSARWETDSCRKRRVRAQHINQVAYAASTCTPYRCRSCQVEVSGSADFDLSAAHGAVALESGHRGRVGLPPSSLRPLRPGCLAPGRGLDGAAVR